MARTGGSLASPKRPVLGSGLTAFRDPVDHVWILTDGETSGTDFCWSWLAFRIQSPVIGSNSVIPPYPPSQQRNMTRHSWPLPQNDIHPRIANQRSRLPSRFLFAVLSNILQQRQPSRFRALSLRVRLRGKGEKLPFNEQGGGTMTRALLEQRKQLQ